MFYKILTFEINLNILSSISAGSTLLIKLLFSMPAEALCWSSTAVESTLCTPLHRLHNISYCLSSLLLFSQLSQMPHTFLQSVVDIFWFQCQLCSPCCRGPHVHMYSWLCSLYFITPTSPCHCQQELLASLQFTKFIQILTWPWWSNWPLLEHRRME